MKYSIIQRVNHVIEEKKVSITFLSKELNIVQTTLNRQIKGETQISAQTIEAILHHYPDISAEWLLRGEGNMIKGHSLVEPEVSTNIGMDNVFSFYERTIERNEKKIEELTIMVGRLQHEVEMLRQDKKTAPRKDDVLGVAKKSGTTDR